MGKYDYNRFGSKGKRVGQAVVDILEKGDNPYISTGEIFDASSEKFLQELEDTISKNKDRYDSPFYVVVFTNKEFWAENVVRNWFVARQSAPYATDLVCQYPNHNKTLYLVDANEGKIKICWTMPGFQEAKSILKTPQHYDPQLVQWIEDVFNCKLDKESYSFD